MYPKPRFRSIDCVLCGFKIKLDGLLNLENIPDSKWDPETQSWDGGMVASISAGYGSILDGYYLYIGICDRCTKNKLENGSLVYWGNYMGKDDENRYKILKNRKDGLDNLLDYLD